MLYNDYLSIFLVPIFISKNNDSLTFIDGELTDFTYFRNKFGIIKKIPYFCTIKTSIPQRYGKRHTCMA